ncbi:MAG: hypothetical protein SNF93_02565 [Rikenellaceae bacterium]
MYKKILYFAISIALFVACNKEEELSPSGYDLNWYALEESDNALDQLRYQIYSAMGVTIFYNDVIGTQERGTDFSGNPIIYEEVLDPNYAIISNTGNIQFIKAFIYDTYYLTSDSDGNDTLVDEAGTVYVKVAYDEDGNIENVTYDQEDGLVAVSTDADGVISVAYGFENGTEYYDYGVNADGSTNYSSSAINSTTMYNNSNGVLRCIYADGTTEIKYGVAYDEDSITDAVNFLTDEVIADLPTVLYPRCYLVVEKLYPYTKQGTYVKCNTTVVAEGMMCTVIGNASSYATLTDEEKLEYKLEMISEEYGSYLVENYNTQLATFYTFSEDVYGDYVYNTGVTYFDNGFLKDNESWSSSSKSTTYYQCPTAELDVTEYVKAILQGDDETFYTTYAAYDSILAKYEAMKIVLREFYEDIAFTGFGYDFVQAEIF